MPDDFSKMGQESEDSKTARYSDQGLSLSIGFSIKAFARLIVAVPFDSIGLLSYYRPLLLDWLKFPTYLQLVCTC